ncbi:MAG: hypothetical protein HQK54_10840 [Oligoflexales bacterium]|nr:hypothetical protein [Oligoflexales bacterium]
MKTSSIKYILKKEIAILAAGFILSTLSHGKSDGTSENGDKPASKNDNENVIKGIDGANTDTTPSVKAEENPDMKSKEDESGRRPLRKRSRDYRAEKNLYASIGANIGTPAGTGTAAAAGFYLNMNNSVEINLLYNENSFDNFNETVIRQKGMEISYKYFFLNSLYLGAALRYSSIDIYSTRTNYKIIEGSENSISPGYDLVRDGNSRMMFGRLEAVRPALIGGNEWLFNKFLIGIQWASLGVYKKISSKRNEDYREADVTTEEGMAINEYWLNKPMGFDSVQDKGSYEVRGYIGFTF